ncbi:MAG: bifunctional diaminohydroxyphosphoribosylaminopyrimidine deaminase/5-amino-6-(5-phosphoribosylamino)uracil reductase RibD [Acidobacteriota bacterium]
MASTRDSLFMQRALELARQGRGLASPNPKVGALLVKDHTVVGEGTHRYAEQKHAEVWALEQAGEQAVGSTLYVNLEPCSHVGRTPPCVDHIIQAGVRCVVAAMQDPNPRVSGKGFEQLRRHGVEVRSGVLEAEAQKLNESFSKFIRTGRPFVVLKAGMTLDGRIGFSSGPTRWITSERARAEAHQIRLDSDAILVGIGTVLKDDPLLTDRSGEPRRRPLVRAVLDTHLRLPPASRLIQSRSEGDIIAFCLQPPDPGKTRALERSGVEVLAVPGEAGRIPWSVVLEELGRREILQLLVEGGSTIHFDALRAGVADKMVCFVAPRVLGEAGTIPFVGGSGFEPPEQAPELRFAEVAMLNDHLMIEAYIDPTHGNS